MMNPTATVENAPVHFFYDHINQKIVGTRKDFDLSGNPNSPLYDELMARIAGQPTYTFRVIERKKCENKKVMPEIYKAYTKQIASRRFSISM